MKSDAFDRFSPTSTRAFAHAKLNLILRVLAREASGYHGIETLFQALELADVVDVTLDDHERTLDCDGPTMPAGGLGPMESNLATRAAAAYTEATRWETGWKIEIEKNIPVGGGLGGGSADAAAVLRALEALSPSPMGSAALIELAGTLGADVPFLLSGAPLAWAWSRGDRFLPLPALPRMGVALITFSEGVNTGAAYAAVARARESTAAMSVSGNAQHGATQFPGDAFATWSSVAGLATNDFEPVVMGLHAGVNRWLPVVRQATVRLTDYGAPAIGMMSGSGATCFLLAPDELIPELGRSAEMRTLRTHTASAVVSF